MRLFWEVVEGMLWVVRWIDVSLGVGGWGLVFSEACAFRVRFWFGLVCAVFR